MDNSEFSDSSDQLLSIDNHEGEPFQHLTKKHAAARKRLRYWTIFNSLTSVLLLCAVILQTCLYQSPFNQSAEQSYPYSPITKSLELQFYDSVVDGGIAASTKHSIARLPPGPEADAAWKRFEGIRTVVISKADIVAMGKDPETAAKFPNEHWGFGEDAYMGQLDVVHQLHCLNQLRKRAFAAYHNPGVEQQADEHPEWSWIHLQHCTSILLETLTCHADTELLTMNWIREVDYPFPDFSVHKKCRNFESLLDWQAERAVSMDQWLNMSKPANGVAILAGEKEWFGLFEEGEANAAQHHHER